MKKTVRICMVGAGRVGKNHSNSIKRFVPGAEIVGLVDSSPEMLKNAAEGGGGVRYALGDIGEWRTELPVDVLFSNAALHWLGDHAGLLPRLREDG